MNSRVLRIRTLNLVQNADPFHMGDYHIVAELQLFDIVNQTYKVAYYREIPGNDENSTPTLDKIHYFPSLFLSADQVNYLLAVVLKVDLNANGTPLQNIQAAMHEAFRIKVGSDGRFGIPAGGWEKL